MDTNILKLEARKKEIELPMLQEFDFGDGHRFIRGRANHHLGHYIRTSVTDIDPSGWAVFDDAKRGGSVFERQEDNRIFFIYLSDVTFSTIPQSEAYGLLVAKAPTREGRYIRIGIAAMSDNQWIGNMPEETIEIE